MYKRYNDWRKYVLPLAVLVIVGFGMYLQTAYHAHEDSLVREKAFEKRQDVNLICDTMEQIIRLDDEVNAELVQYALWYAVSHIESEYVSTFAQLYQQIGGNLTPLIELSPGVAGGLKHNPLDYPEFVESIQKHDDGSLVYWYATEEAGGRNVHMYYRRVSIPDGNGYDTRYLVAVGISKYTITEHLDPSIIYGTIALVIVASVIVLGCALLLIRLGHIYEERAGDKWRGDNDRRR